MKLSFGTWALLAALALTAVITVLTGCSTEKRLAKQIVKAKGLAYQYPTEFAEFCGKIYPPKDSAGKDSVEIVPSKNTDYTEVIADLERRADEAEARAKQDTTNIGKKYRAEIGSLRADISSLKSKYKPCEPSTRTTRTIWQTNTGALSNLKSELDKMSKDYNKVSEELKESKITARNWRIIGISALGAIAVIIFFAIKRK